MGSVLSVFFDVDQTLWDFERLMRRALARTIDELLRLGPETHGDLSVESFVTDRHRVGEAHSRREARAHDPSNTRNTDN